MLRIAVAVLLSAGLALAGEANQLTAEERAAGWRLLFDGRSFHGWTGMKGTWLPTQSWKVEDGMIATQEDGSGGDLATQQDFDNFELQFDFKISAGGNSGVKYLVQQEWLSPHWAPDDREAFKRAQAISAVGPEYQIFDDDAMEKKPGWELSATGSVYLLFASKNKNLKPAGEWNTARIVVRGNRVEHWLNGGKLLEWELGSQETLAKVKETKFIAVPGFGRKAPGPIVLQHHGSPAWFRNVKVREF